MLEDNFWADVPWPPKSPDAEPNELSDDLSLASDRQPYRSTFPSQIDKEVEPLSSDELSFPFDNEPPFCLENNTLIIHQCRAPDADPTGIPEPPPEAIPTT